MGDPRAGFQHETRHPANGKMGADAGLVHDNKGTVEHIEVSLFHVKDRDAVFHGDGFKGRKLRLHC